MQYGNLQINALYLWFCEELILSCTDEAVFTRNAYLYAWALCEKSTSTIYCLVIDGDLLSLPAKYFALQN